MDNTEEKPFQAFDHGNDAIDLTKHRGLIQMLPVEIHHNANGSLLDGPVFAIVLTAPNLRPVVGQISLDMLNEALKDIQYQVIRVKEL